MATLKEKGANVGIFYSYDTEPLAGQKIIAITKTVLRAIIKSPPSALLLHTRTAHATNPDLRALLRDVGQATNLIV